MSVYYNEWEPHAAQWIRNLIGAGHLPAGDVDERDIREVKADEIRGYTQHHFFAGIGGWALAARLAGVHETARIITGSPPCQPFSTAGRQRGINDDRHLAPAWLELVKAIRPSFVFGEQVAAAINKDAWLDVLLDELEGEGYTTGAIVLPACSQGAPHIRQRVWFAGRLADSASDGHVTAKDGRGIGEKQSEGRMQQSQGACSAGRLGDAQREGLEGLAWNGDGAEWQEQAGSIAEAGIPSRLAESDSARSQSRSQTAEGARHWRPVDSESCSDRLGSAHATTAGWDDVDWLWCRDGKWRPVESGTFPLAHGVSARVGRLRAYGNAIVPQVAAEVIMEAMK